MKEGHVLRQAAKELLEAGFRVFVWGNDIYNSSWNEGDFTTVMYAYDNDPRIGCIHHGEFFGIEYGRVYKPSHECGSSCGMDKSSVIEIEKAISCINNPIWTHSRDKNGSYIPSEQYTNIDEWHEKGLFNKEMFHEVKTVEEIENESE